MTNNLQLVLVFAQVALQKYFLQVLLLNFHCFSTNRREGTVISAIHHYNVSVRITTKIFTSFMLCVLILYIVT